MRKRITIAIVALGALVVGAVAAAAAGGSFGVFRDQQLAAQSNTLFGVGKPLGASSTVQLTQAQAQADPRQLAALAKGLKARVVTTQGPAVDDQITLWPNDQNPTYLIAFKDHTIYAALGPDRAGHREREHHRDGHDEL
jgi:hypothetical protein